MLVLKWINALLSFKHSREYTLFLFYVLDFGSQRTIGFESFCVQYCLFNLDPYAESSCMLSKVKSLKIESDLILEAMFAQVPAQEEGLI